VEGRIDILDKNVVFGMFNYSGVDGRDEMDIEYSKLGSRGQQHKFYHLSRLNGIQPIDWHTTYNTTLTGTYTIQHFTRNNATLVYFQELGGLQSGNTNQITSAACRICLVQSVH
jgi:hypothetical protein